MMLSVFRQILVLENELKKLSSILAAGIFIAASPVAAEQSVYGGLGVLTIAGREEGVNFSTTNAVFTLGINFNEHFAIEGEFSTVLSEDSITLEGTSVDIGLKHWGVYARYNFVPVSEEFILFGRLGYVTGTAEATAGGVSVSEAEDALGVGVGAEYRYSEKGSIRFDLGYADFGDTTSNWISIGNSWRF